MTQNGPTDSISRVLELGGDYFTCWNLERVKAGIATSQPGHGLETGITDDYLKAQERRNEARAELLKIIPVLAVQLEDADVDSSGLLLFLHRIDGGGGPEEAIKGWAALKVHLQRAAILLGKRGAVGFTTPKERRAKWVANAMMLVRDHPDWSNADVAKHKTVDVDPSRLSRCDDYQRAAMLARQRRLPKGGISIDPDTGERTLEAPAPDDAE